MVFKELGAEVIAMNITPNGENINHECGSTHPEGLKKAVIEHKADLGLAYDGDADRLIAVDEKGHEVDGDHIMILGAVYLKKQNKLAKRRLVVKRYFVKLSGKPKKTTLLQSDHNSFSMIFPLSV